MGRVIFKIRSLREAVRAGQIRLVLVYDILSDSNMLRIDYFHRENGPYLRQTGFFVRSRCDLIRSRYSERSMMALNVARRNINKHIASIGIEAMFTPPAIYNAVVVCGEDALDQFIGVSKVGDIKPLEQ